LPSYVDFLKKHGIVNAQGECKPNTVTLGYHAKHGINNCPDGQFLAHNYPSEAMACVSKPLTCTSLRIIQKNYEIIPLTEEDGELIEKNYTLNFANKRDLIIFETEILNKYDINNLNIYFANDLLLEYASKRFKIYLKNTVNQKRYILIEKKDKDKKIRKLLPIESRFSKSYQKKVRKRMNWLIYKYGNAKAVNLTLTINPKKYKYNKFKMWKEIKKELNRFLTALKYYFKKRNIPFPPYICTIEAQKEPNSRGNPHFHFVFLNAKRLLDWRKIRKLWGLGHIYINRTYDGYNIKYPINYITKYITKTFTENNEENLLTQSLCWLFHIRSFSTSRGLITPINSIDTGEWKPICLIVGNEFFELSDIKNLFEVDEPLSYIYKDHWI